MVVNEIHAILILMSGMIAYSIYKISMLSNKIIDIESANTEKDIFIKTLVEGIDENSQKIIKGIDNVRRDFSNSQQKSRKSKSAVALEARIATR